MSRLAETPRSVNIAVMALGGQGGGVLVDWIVGLAEHHGWTAQATSVAGVAQRTGATIYYVELVEPTPGREPVLALMPIPGEVDVLIAAELMEAGRAVQRGFVTSGRTTLIASSHRTYAVSEKTAPANGIADAARVLDIVRSEAKRAIVDDLQALAVRHRSVISASLFGALAGSGALPFAQSEFEAVVERSGVGVAASLAALREASELARHAPPPSAPAEIGQHSPRPLPSKAASPALQPLVERIRSEYPEAAHAWLAEGLARVVEWQDIDYGKEYLDRIARLLSAAPRADPATDELVKEAARWIAASMCYDDVIRVADLKTRGARYLRIRQELGAAPADVVRMQEFFHPREEEVMGLLPRRLADWLDRSPHARNAILRVFAGGRRIRSDTVRGYLQLRLLAALRRWRRHTRRHAEESARQELWLKAVRHALQGDSALAIELLRCQRLIKGYSDTHERGLGRFERLLSAAERLEGQPDAGSSLRVLREAALRDADGRALDTHLRALGIAA